MLIKVKVFHGSKKNEVIKKGEDSFEVKVRKKPLQGKANKAVLFLISSHFNLSSQKARIVKGFKKRNKIIQIHE